MPEIVDFLAFQYQIRGGVDDVLEVGFFLHFLQDLHLFEIAELNQDAKDAVGDLDIDVLEYANLGFPNVLISFQVVLIS